MTERSKILYATGARLSIGGLEKHLLTLGEGLREEFEICLLGEPREPFLSQWEQLGLRILPIQVKGKFDLSAVRAIRKAIRKESPDLIHILDSRAGLLTRLAKIGCGVPVVYSIHYPAYRYVDISKLRQLVNGQIEKVLNLQLTDVVVFPYENTYNDAISRNLVRKGQGRLIPSGIDTAPFLRASQALGSRERTCQGNSPEMCRLIVVSRLSAEKNIELAINSLAKLIEHGYLASLTVVGDGPKLDDLRTLSEQMGLSRHIQFLGYRDDVPQLLAQADIFLLTSKFDAGPYVLMEAMAAGKPCVSTDVGDVRWMLKDSAGVVVSDPSPESFSSSIAELIDNERLRNQLGANAQKKAVAEFSIKLMLAAYSKLYGEIAGGLV